MFGFTFDYIFLGVMTVVEVHTVLLNLSYPMEHHHRWFPSEFILIKLIQLNLCVDLCM